MSVTACNYDRAVCDAQSDELGLGIYTIGWVARCNSEMGPNAVLQGCQSISGTDPIDGTTNVAVPTRWTTYSFKGDTDGLSYARDYKVTRDKDNTKVWRIQVTYRPPESGAGSQTVGGSPINSVSNPTSRAPVMWWDREVFTYEALYDINGKAIVNKCQDYYPEAIELESTRGVLVVEKNVATLSAVRALSEKYDNAVNSVNWNVAGSQFAASRQALCREVSSGPPNTESGYVYFKVSMRFALKPAGQTWDEKKAEYGQYHWTKKSDGSYDTISQGLATHRSLTNAGALVKLNDDGTRRPFDQDTVWTDWRIRREVNFNDLAL